MNNALLEKARRELLKPAAKRQLGHDRDPTGFFLLVSLLIDSDDDSELLFTCEMPAKIHCGTCRFGENDPFKAPCVRCWGEEWTNHKPYPMWRRGN